MKNKKLAELREAKQKEMNELLNKVTVEERAFNADEKARFEALEAEIRSIDETNDAIERARDLETEEQGEQEEQKEERSVEQREYDDFDAFLRSEVRAESTMTMTDNGAVVPTSIANKIIEKVVEICPIFADADRYNVKGNLTIPYYDEATSDIMMAYADEDTDGESTSGAFKSISLGGFLGRAITDVSKSLINNSNFDIVEFVVARMAKAIARFIEKELLNGTDGKVAGLSGVTQKVVCASANAITSDEIIDLQESVPDVYQPNAYFIMSKATRTAVRKLKDGQGNYLLNKDANSRWGYTLFGKDVYTTENMSNIASGKTVMYYGDPLGLAVKVSEDVNIDVLRETKARKHMVEVLGFVEFDAKVQNAQMLSALVMA